MKLSDKSDYIKKSPQKQPLGRFCFMSSEDCSKLEKGFQLQNGPVLKCKHSLM